MAYYTGSDGYLEYSRLVSSGVYDTKKVAKVRGWNFDTSLKLLPTTTLGDFAESYLPSTTSGQGSAQLIYYRFEPTDPERNTDYQFTALLRKIMTTGRVGESSRVRLNLKVGAGVKDTLTMNAYINSARMNSSTSELSIVDIQFTQDGPLITVPAIAQTSPYVE